MKKIVSFFAVVSFLLTFTSVFGIVQWHPAGEIGPGTFGENVSIGDYTFPQNVLVEGHLSAPIFYDSNNAAYYVNPNGASNIYSLTTASSVSIGGNLNMNSHQINNVANPSSSSDALNLGYADDHYVNVAGDTMTGDLNMNGHNINGVNTLTASSFVDRDNTGYYLNPSSTSKVDKMWVTGDLLVQGKISNVNVENLNTNGSLIPTFDNKFNLGSSSYRWQNGYFSNDVQIGSSIQDSSGVNRISFSGPNLIIILGQ